MSGKLSSALRGSDRFVTRRRLRRRRVVIALCVLFLIALGALIWGLWQSSVRISRVEVYGADASFGAYARHAMQGSYFGMVPRDSIFFFPASRIRTDIIAAHPDVGAVSIFRNGLTGLSIKAHGRVPIARWCGSTSSPQVVPSFDNCYVFDASGFIFATVATSTQTLNSFKLYAPLEGEVLEPLRASIADAEKLPGTFDFARELSTFGSSVTRVVIRDDEVDEYLTSGTRITYVLGNEQNAFTALVSARENFNLADGSLEYIDLRFDRKMYLKKKQ